MVTCPRPPVFAQPNILVASFATQARACILSDHNIFYTPRGGGNGGVMPLGLFLFHVRFLTVYLYLYLAWVILHLFDATFTVYNNCTSVLLTFSYFFFPICIRMRNLLSSQVVNATALNCFKAAAGSQKLKFEVNQHIFIDCNLTAAPSIIRGNKLFR